MAIDLSGVLPNYKINRPLTEREQGDRLDVKQSQGKQPHYELSLLKMNSNYAESIENQVYVNQRVGQLDFYNKFKKNEQYAS